jgi:hypothetical protein
MVVSREDVVARLKGYLEHRISLEELVGWAERVMMEEGWEEEHSDVLRDVLARLGLADVQAFGLTWEDCEEMLGRLGYRVKIELSRV